MKYQFAVTVGLHGKVNKEVEMKMLKWAANPWQAKFTSKSDLYEPDTNHIFYSWHPPDSRYCIGYFYGLSTKYGTDEKTVHYELHFWFFSFNYVYTIHTGEIYND